MSEQIQTQNTSGKWTDAEREGIRKMFKMALIIFLVVLVTVIIMALLVPEVGGPGQNIRPV